MGKVLRTGLMPQSDAAPRMVAHEFGYDEKVGIAQERGASRDG